MDHGISVRLAEAKDTDAIVRFNLAMAHETEDKELDLSVLMAGVRSLMQKTQYGFYVVAEHESDVVGCLMVTYEWTDWRNGLFWWIQSVFIKDDFRRRGVYRRLYEFVKAIAAENADVRGFRLYVEKENRIAQLTYEKLGMRQTQYLLFEEIMQK